MGAGASSPPRKRAPLGAGDGPARLGVLSNSASRGVLAPDKAMTILITPQHMGTSRTTWHITFGIYGTRLHGSGRATVDKQHNQLGEPFIDRNLDREASDRGRMRFAPRYLTSPQRTFAESEIPTICDRGGWKHRVCCRWARPHSHLM